VRLDLNVPLDENRMVTDSTRIEAAIPTLKLLLNECESVVAMSHLGRPKGKRVGELSLAPVVPVLERLLGSVVRLAPDCRGHEVRKLSTSAKRGELLLLQNLRFHPEEEANDSEFARELASLGSLFVNDAFGAAHRAHASTAGIARFVETSVSGLLMEREINFLQDAMRNPVKPCTAILGGAKVSDKIELIDHLLDKVDRLLIGGAMSFTFLRAQNHPVGKFLVGEEHIGTAKEILKKSKVRGVPIFLPSDAVAVEEIRADAPTRTVASESFPADWHGVDIGSRTCVEFANQIEDSRTVIWNGPMGIFEMEAFSTGSRDVAKAIAAATDGGCTSIIGGGDTAAAVRQAGVAERMTHISTGGGASLECLSGRDLPGVVALTEKSG
jgi:phosphoglycerate kinase